MSEFNEDSLPDELKMFADVERYLHGAAKKIREHWYRNRSIPSA